MDGRGGRGRGVPSLTAVRVLEIGPDTVRVISGAVGRVDPRLARAALEWIDHPVGLYDERPVAVADMWRAVMMTVGRGERVLTLVHPDDWTRSRVDRVVAAADAVAGEVVAVPRRHWNADPDSGSEDDAEDDAGCDARAGHPARGRRLRLLAVGAAAVAALLSVGTASVVRPARAQNVVEGRIAVQIPAEWTITRVTGGPGSRRLQATPPADPETALHITQSYAPEATPARVAADLRRRINDQPAGVFVDLQAEARVGGHPAVTYRELRPGRVIDWSVVLVGSTLIGIGCQSSPQRTDAVRIACERAVASARENGAF